MRAKTILKKAKGIFILLIVFINTQVFSQSSVKILDLIISQVLKTDTTSFIADTALTELQQVDSLINDSVQLKVLFKVNNPAQAVNAHLLLGTEKDLPDVMSVDAHFINQQGVFYLEMNGNATFIKNYATNIVIKLSRQQYNNYKFATLFVEDNSGQNSSKLYFQKQ